MTTFGSGDHPMLASFQSELLQFRTGAVAIAALHCISLTLSQDAQQVVRGFGVERDSPGGYVLDHKHRG